MQNIVEKEQMTSLKALADVNIKISEARNLLFTLQEQETEYLIAREKKAMDRIQKTIDDSKELVKEADSNHAEIKALLNGVLEFKDKLLKAHEGFTGLLVDFDQRNVEWERSIGLQQDNITDIRNQLKIERVVIENDKKNLESARKKLTDDQKKLDSDRGTIDRKIKRFKEGRI